MPFLRSHSRRESGATAIDANANTSTKATHPSRPPPNRTADSEAYDHRPSMERKTGLARYTDDLEAAALEFAGTVLFLVIALGGVQSLPVPATTTNAVEFMLRNLYVACVFGLSLLVSAWLFFRATGGLFNPNVSFALLLTGVISPIRFVLYCIAQLAGGIVAAALVVALLPGPLASNTVPAPQINTAQAVFIEGFITMALCLAVLMLGAEKHRSTPFAPIGVGLTLFACHLFALGYTGAAMNTARAFGPAVVSGFSSSVFSGKDVGKHWVYWVGPTIGAIAASGVYVLLKRIHYWKLSPGQDAVHQPASPDPSPTEEYVERAERGELGGDNGDGQSEGPAMGEKRGRS